MVINFKDKHSDQTKVVNVTNDIIKEWPTFSGTGKKNITIIYGGQEYSFNINVINPYVKMVERFLNYLQNYPYTKSTKIYLETSNWMQNAIGFTC